MSERLWWTRAGLVLVRPIPVFEELRDDSHEEAQARQEPVVAIVVLAGIAGVLATTFAGTLVEDEGLDEVEVALWAFLGGALEGFTLYFVVGALVFAGGWAVGSTWRYRHARHLLAYSVVPLAASLPIWALALAAEEGGGLDLVRALVLVWASALLVVGLRTLHAWSWRRTLAAAALPLVVPALVLARVHGLL
ncbi:MAG: YIP1 family protein [Thermoleophilia bacterium]|nr:YIP1 family protein [Thermoleophilia bacterium]